MMLNGLYALAWAAVIMGAVYWIPKALKYDANLAALDDEEEFEIVTSEFPDAKVRWSRW